MQTQTNPPNEWIISSKYLLFAWKVCVCVQLTESKEEWIKPRFDRIVAFKQFFSSIRIWINFAWCGLSWIHVTVVMRWWLFSIFTQKWTKTATTEEKNSNNKRDVVFFDFQHCLNDMLTWSKFPFNAMSLLWPYNTAQSHTKRALRPEI